jgi:hypothetical protein
MRAQRRWPLFDQSTSLSVGRLSGVESPISIMSFLPPPADGLGGVAEDNFRTRERELEDKAARYAKIHPDGTSADSPRLIRRLLHRLRALVKPRA